MKFFFHIIFIKFVVAFIILTHLSDLSSKAPLCISLGHSCGPAIHLRYFKLRTEAYPFDWITSHFDSLYQALKDDFKYFLSDLKNKPGYCDGVIDYYGFHFI